MSSKLHHMQSIAGFKDLKQILDLITNADTYGKLMKELEASYNKSVDIVNLVGPAEEIMSLNIIAKEEKAEADQFLKAARVEVIGLISDAKKDVSKLQSEAREVLAGREQHIKDLGEKLTARALELKKVSDDVISRELNVAKKEELVSKQSLDVSLMQKQLRTKLDELNEKFKV